MSNMLILSWPGFRPKKKKTPNLFPLTIPIMEQSYYNAAWYTTSFFLYDHCNSCIFQIKYMEKA